MITAVINGQPHEFGERLSILKACRCLGVDISPLCHDDRLIPIGSCRRCLVEIKAQQHHVTACNTDLTASMVISTKSPLIDNERRVLLRMLARNRPGEGGGVFAF